MSLVEEMREQSADRSEVVVCCDASCELMVLPGGMIYKVCLQSVCLGAVLTTQASDPFRANSSSETSFHLDPNGSLNGGALSCRLPGGTNTQLIQLSCHEWMIEWTIEHHRAYKTISVHRASNKPGLDRYNCGQVCSVSIPLSVIITFGMTFKVVFFLCFTIASGNALQLFDFQGLLYGVDRSRVWPITVGSVKQNENQSIVDIHFGHRLKAKKIWPSQTVHSAFVYGTKENCSQLVLVNQQLDYASMPLVINGKSIQSFVNGTTPECVDSIWKGNGSLKDMSFLKAFWQNETDLKFMFTADENRKLFIAKNTSYAIVRAADDIVEHSLPQELNGVNTIVQFQSSYVILENGTKHFVCKIVDLDKLDFERPCFMVNLKRQGLGSDNSDDDDDDDQKSVTCPDWLPLISLTNFACRTPSPEWCWSCSAWWASCSYWSRAT